MGAAGRPAQLARDFVGTFEEDRCVHSVGLISFPFSSPTRFAVVRLSSGLLLIPALLSSLSSAPARAQDAPAPPPPSGASGAAAPGPSVPAAPTPELGPRGIVRLHVDSELPVSVQSWTRPGTAAHPLELSPVCMAPCDQVVDASHGEHFQASGNFRGTMDFELTGLAGDVELEVAPGNARLHEPGWGLAVIGGIGMGVGLSMLLLGQAESVVPSTGGGSSGSSLTPIGGATLGAGVVMVLAGIVLLDRSRAHFELHSQPSPRGPAWKTRYWLGE